MSDSYLASMSSGPGESADKSAMKRCPYCGQTIDADAIVCSICGRGLTTFVTADGAPIPELDITTTTAAAVPLAGGARQTAIPRGENVTGETVYLDLPGAYITNFHAILDGRPFILETILMTMVRRDSTLADSMSGIGCGFLAACLLCAYGLMFVVAAIISGFWIVAPLGALFAIAFGACARGIWKTKPRRYSLVLHTTAGYVVGMRCNDRETAQRVMNAIGEAIAERR